MERKSPRTGQGARAVKSVARDTSALTISTVDGLERKPGERRTDGGLGYPEGCSGLSRKALAVCAAGLRKSKCIACVRSGNLPWPADWPQGCANIIGTRSVQALRSARDGVWYCVAFTSGFQVDPRFPVIACKTRHEAVQFALKRGRQIEPYAPIEERGPGDWRMGSLFIWALGDGK
jgi:hypothetical protein